MATWLEEVTAGLESIGGQGSLDEIYEAVSRSRGAALPKNWKAIVRKELEYNSSDSEAHLNRRDLFYSIAGIRGGVWGLRAADRAPKEAIDLVDSPPSTRVQVQTYRILRDTQLARRLKQLHKDQCQICGATILMGDGSTYSEAHHIQPLGRPHNGPDRAENIVVLCPNHHAAMDFGAFEVSSSTFRAAKGHSIGPQFINYHNNVIVQSAVPRTGAVPVSEPMTKQQSFSARRQILGDP